MCPDGLSPYCVEFSYDRRSTIQRIYRHAPQSQHMTDFGFVYLIYCENIIAAGLTDDGAELAHAYPLAAKS